jgi:hypothetical protein
LIREKTLKTVKAQKRTGDTITKAGYEDKNLEVVETARREVETKSFDCFILRLKL